MGALSRAREIAVAWATRRHVHASVDRANLDAGLSGYNNAASRTDRDD